MVRGIEAVREFRRQRSDSYNFNWLLSIQPEFQQPFEVTHESMRALALDRDQPVHQLAANLRRAFSGIVTGNVKEHGIKAIEQRGPYELAGDRGIMQLLDELLAAFVAQQRMKLPGSDLSAGVSPGGVVARLDITLRLVRTVVNGRHACEPVPRVRQPKAVRCGKGQGGSMSSTDRGRGNAPSKQKDHARQRARRPIGRSGRAVPGLDGPHATRARASRRDHAQSQHLVELQELGRPHARVLGGRGAEAGRRRAHAVPGGTNKAR